jgi:hypothetical protein
MEGAKFPAKLNDPTTVVGLRGVMFASAPAAPACPATAAGWAALAAAPGAEGLVLTSAPSRFISSPLEIVPEMLYANIFKVPLNISRLAANLTLGPAAAGSSAAAPRLAMTAAAAGGFVFSNTSVTGGAALNPFSALGPAVGAPTARFSEREGGGQRWLYLEFPDFNMTWSSETGKGMFAASGTLDFGFAGPLVLRAPLACDKDCGPRGRCKGGGNATTPVCECECGWGPSRRTGACTVPQGYCSIYGGGTALMAAGGGAAAGTASSILRSGGGADADQLSSAGTTCPAGYGYSIRSKSCAQCTAGFSGPGCNTCSNNAACAARTGAAGATCASGLTFAERSRAKHYSCALSDTSIAAVVGPVLAFSCNTTGPDGQPWLGAAGNRSRGSGLSGERRLGWGGGWRSE